MPTARTAATAGIGAPPDQPGGQLGVGPHPEGQDVGRLGQLLRGDLGDRADEGQHPLRAGGGDAGQEVEVEPLVDDPVEADDRPAQLGKLRVAAGSAGGLGEVDGLFAGQDDRITPAAFFG